MDFECNFDDANFCQYSSLGWGFQKSLKIANKLMIESIQNSNNNLRQNFHVTNIFPCTDYKNAHDVSKLTKMIPKNMSKPLCLRMAYLLEEKGQITITDHKTKWQTNSTKYYNQWNYINFPVNHQKSELSANINSLEITGRSICVDNFTVSNVPCSSRDSFHDNKFSSDQTLWFTQPFNILLAIITLMIVLVLIGVILSFVCAKKTQRTLRRSKQSSRRNKNLRVDRTSLQTSVNINDATINSTFESFGSSRQCSNQNRFLPAVVHVRSNPQLFCFSRHHSFMASKSVESNDTNPNCRFSLALTEDAQVQLLTNSNLNSASPPVSSDLSSRNLPIARQQSFTTTISHERTPSPTDQFIRSENSSQQRPQSIVVVPSFCAPILDQSESDLSMESINMPQMSQNITRLDRSRPIRESMNIGYVSDNSPYDLPHYDAALELLAAHKMKLAQSKIVNDQSDVANNNNTDELDQFDALN